MSDRNDETRRLKAALDAAAASVCAALLPEGKRQGTEWYASGTRSPTGAAISVCITGSKQGVVLFCGDGRGGDILDLIQEVHRCDFPESLDNGRGLIGWGNEARPAPPPDPDRRPRARDEAIDRQRAAKRIWGACEDGILATPAAAYLRIRGLHVPKQGWPTSLRYHAGLPHPSGVTFPALVCRVNNFEGRFLGVWRIWITKNGEKAPVEPQKMGLGPCKGGFVRLSAWSDFGALTEGVETGLAVAEMTNRCALACLSTSGLMNFHPPQMLSDVAIYGDSDPWREVSTPQGSRLMPPPGEHAATCAEARLRAEFDLRVKTMLPGSNGAKSDWLDVLCEMRASERFGPA